MSPKDFITEIRSTEFQLNDDGRPKPGFARLLERLNRMSEHLSDGLYERTDHFIFELIQNAEDNDYLADTVPSIEFRLLEDDPTGTAGAKGCLCIFNNETGFEGRHVRALCDFNNSTKKGQKAEGFIGEKGIGFKSVFTITDSPHIFSNGYKFKFKRNDPVATIGFVVPYWVDHLPDIVQNNHVTTSILLPLRDQSYEYIKEQLEAFSPETILFLRNLKSLEIVTTGSEKIIECEGTDNIKVLSHIIDDEMSQRRFWIESDIFEVPHDLDEEKREKVIEREITIAFPLDGVTGDERVFAYLPTEERTGLPFYLNADFLLPASRENIIKTSTWNRWLIGNVGKVVGKGILTMLKNDQEMFNAYQFIPLRSDVSQGSRDFQRVCDVVKEILKGKACVITEDGSQQRPQKCCQVGDELRRLLDGDKPTYFQEVFLAHDRLSDVVNRLRHIGVDSIPRNGLLAIFSDETWLKDHSLEWFASLYAYLIGELKQKKQYRQLNIIPTESGELASPESVFLQAEEQKKLLKRIPAKFRQKVNFVSAAVLDAISAHEESDEILHNLAMADFSVASFIESILLPSIDMHAISIDIGDVKLILTFVFGCWKEIENDLEIHEILPVLLANNQLLDPVEGDKREIVYPISWDKDTGWQLVFKTKAEQERLFILHDFYCGLDRKTVEKYFELIDATDAPSAMVVEISDIDDADGVEREYLEYIDKEFLSNYSINSTMRKVVYTCLPPSVISGEKPPRRKNYAAFVKWLEKIGRQRCARGQYSYYGPKNHPLDSALYWRIRTSKWIKTTQGLRRPGEVFVKEPTLQRIFGNKLPYLEGKYKESVVKSLGINRGATEETLIKYLGELSSSVKVEKPTLVAVYEYLREHLKDYEEQFEESSLIYIGDEDGQWFKTNEVVWEDASVAIGGAFGWLDTYYPHRMRDFFVGKLGVKERIDDELIAGAWLRKQEEDADEEQTDAFVEVAMPRIMHALDEQIGKWQKQFVEKALVWTQDKCWRDPKFVFVPDDRRLRNLFGDQLQYIWLPEHRSHAHFTALHHALSVRKLSQAAVYSLSRVGSATIREDNKLLTDHCLRLLAYAIANLDKQDAGDFQRCIEKGLLEKLCRCTEVEVDELVVQVVVDYDSEELRELCAFFDHENGRMFLDLNAEEEDYVDDVVDEISRFLWGASYKDYADIVRNLLGIESDRRYRKLRDRHDWHLGRDEQRQVEEMLKFGKRLLKRQPEDGQDSLDEESNHPDISGIPEQEEPAEENEVDKTEEIRKEDRSTGVPNDDAADTDSRTPEGTGYSEHRDKSAPAQKPGNRSRRSTSGATSPSYAGGRSRGGRSRSQGIASSANQARRNQLRSYVANELSNELDREDGSEAQEARRELGKQGEIEVMEDLQAKGFDVTRMPDNHKGYDLEAINPGTTEILYIEVKGTAFEWGTRGVGITPSQYRFAVKKKTSFYLAVIENLRAAPRNIYYIRDPTNQITEYRFDDGWEGIADPIKMIVANGLGAENTLDRLLELTPSEECKNIINYCHERNYPYPDLGLELIDDTGKVIFEEIELAWEQERVGVLLSETERDQAQAVDDHWTFYSCSEIDEIFVQLDADFSTDVKCES